MANYYDLNKTYAAGYAVKNNEGKSKTTYPSAVLNDAGVEKNGVIKKSGATVLAVAESVAQGAVKSLEGVFDAAATAVGGIGGIINKSFRDSVRELVEYDATNDIFGRDGSEGKLDWTWGSDLWGTSYLKEGGFVDEVASGVGQMLPAILLSAAVGAGMAAGSSASAARGGAATAASTISAARKATSLGTLFAGASGNATEEAFRDGATYGKGAAYGAVSGSVEAATEMMWDGFGLLGGSGLLKGVIKSKGADVAEVGAKALMKNMAEEGTEEVVSELASPLTKTIYQGKEALKEYGTSDYWKGVAEAGAVGAVASAAAGATIGRVMKTSGKYMDVQEALNTIEENNAALQGEANRGTVTEEMRAKTREANEKNLAIVEERLRNASEKQRETFFRQNPTLSDYFDLEGNKIQKVSFDTVASNAEGTSLYGVDTENAKKYVSENVLDDFEKVNDALIKNEVKVYDGDLSEEAEKGYRDIKDFVDAVNKVTGNKVGLVIASNSPKFKGAISRNNIIITEDTLKGDQYETIAHELAHYSRGTEEYGALANYVLKNTNLEGAKKSILESNYGYTEEDFDEIKKKIENGEMLDERESDLVDEIVAKNVGFVLGTEEQVKLFTEENGSLAKKILNRAKRIIKSIGGDKKENRIAKVISEIRDRLETASEKGGKNKLVLGQRDEEEKTRYLFAEEAKYDEKIRDLQNRFFDETEKLKKSLLKANERGRYSEEFAKEFNGLVKEVRKLKALNSREYASKMGFATISAKILQDKRFNGLIKEATRFLDGGSFSPKVLRERMAAIFEFFDVNNQIFKDFLENIPGEAREGGTSPREYVLSMMESAHDSFFEHYDGTKETFNNDKITIDEMKWAKRMISFVKHIYITYDTAYKNGKRVSITREAEAGSRILEKSLSISGSNASFSFVRDKSKLYEDLITTPQTVFERLDGYDADGFFTTYGDIIAADQLKGQREFFNITEEARNYVENTKGYKERLNKTRLSFDFAGEKADVLVSELIDIWLQASQFNGALTIAEPKGVGFYYTIKNGKQSEATLKLDGPNDLGRLYNAFSTEDKTFIDILKKGYNGKATEMKQKTDIEIMGFSNTIGGEYYPLTRDKAAIASAVGDTRTDFNNLQVSVNKSFNKKRMSRASQIPIVARNCFDKYMSHMSSLTNYAFLASDIRDYQRIYNAPIVLNDAEGARPTSIRELSHKINNDTDAYIRKYMQGVQGVSTHTKTMAEKAFTEVRSKYAVAQLSANIRVFAGQFASYPMANIYLDRKNMMKAMLMKTSYEKMDKYSDAAFVRAQDSQVAKAETLVDKTSKVGNMLGKPIGMIDRYTIGKIWMASQLQIEQEKGMKLGSEENMKEAGKVLDKIVNTTQPTYNSATRSALQRSENELLKSFSMFTSVGMKQASNLISAFGRANFYQKEMKKAEEAHKTEEKRIAKENLKSAKKNLAKTAEAVLEANLMYAIICQAVKHILAKDDKDDNEGKGVVGQMTSKFIETNISIFPFVKEIYSFFTSGYDISVMPVSSVNDMLDSIKDVYGATADAFTGDYDEKATLRTIRSTVFSASMLLGIPTRNVYTLVTGLISRISPSTGYIINNAFYTEKYSKNLQNAIESDDERMVNAISSIILNERVGDGVSKPAREELNRLLVSGYAVLPSDIPEEIDIDGDGEKETVTYTQRMKAMRIYEKAYTEIDEIITSENYKKADDAMKARAILKIFTIQKEKAVDSMKDTVSKDSAVSNVVSVRMMALAYAFKKSSAADVDEEGNKISGSLKAKCEEFVRGLGLSAAQTEVLLRYIGYKTENEFDFVAKNIDVDSVTIAEIEKLYE